MDHITVFQSGNDKITEIMKKNEKEIAGIVLADGFNYGEHTEIESECKINGEVTTLGIKKA